METIRGRQRWRLDPAPVYAGPYYRTVVVWLFFINATLYVVIVVIS